ncbi:MAG TPA: outer membrane lipoprotein-sorting protein [Steroidobacteraceae bacterium]|nr:outer membrane lipoprotein-sorting protein [Steroidobacteraceae bacterium]
MNTFSGLIALAAIGACALAGPCAYADETAPDAQRILAASDAVRNPANPFGLSIVLTEYRDGQEADSNTLAIYSKLDAQWGRYRTLISYVGPPRDAGKLVLESGTQMWFYDPSSEASIRISPQQRLLGQASTGDVVTVNLAHDYHAISATSEDITDGEHTQRHCYKLGLAAAVPDATYHRIELWVEKSSNRPVKGKFYSDSDHLLKTAYYRRFQSELGLERPTEVVIIDGLTPTWVTVMRYSNYAWRDVPDSWLQRDYLPRFRPVSESQSPGTNGAELTGAATPRSR